MQCERPGFDSRLRRSPGKEIRTSSILDWRIPWTEESGELQSLGWQESDMTKWLTHMYNQNIHKKGNWNPDADLRWQRAPLDRFGFIKRDSLVSMPDCILIWGFKLIKYPLYILCVCFIHSAPVQDMDKYRSSLLWPFENHSYILP